jgi:hypothetical protein
VGGVGVASGLGTRTSAAPSFKMPSLAAFCGSFSTNLEQSHLPMAGESESRVAVAFLAFLGAPVVAAAVEEHLLSMTAAQERLCVQEREIERAAGEGLRV